MIVIVLLPSRLKQQRVLCWNPSRRLVFHRSCCGSRVDAQLNGLVSKHAGVDLGLLASPMGVLVSLTSRPGHHVSGDLMQSLADGVRSRLQEWLFAEGQDGMEEVVGRLLTEQNLTVALAESCTGGLIGHRLTQVPGSSAYLDRGIICYSNRAKIELLAVPPELIERHGAVSVEVAAAMARGMRDRSRASVALSVTRHRRPGGATPDEAGRARHLDSMPRNAPRSRRNNRFHGNRSVIKHGHRRRHSICCVDGS